MNGLYIFLFVVIALIVLIVINEIMSSRSRTHKTAIKLKAASIDREAFIGKDLDYCLERLGNYTQGGSMDYGKEVYDWRAGNIWIEIWFKNGVCTSFEVKENKK
jgi:hypothetical protein